MFDLASNATVVPKRIPSECQAIVPCRANSCAPLTDVELVEIQLLREEIDHLRNELQKKILLLELWNCNAA